MQTVTDEIARLRNGIHILIWKFEGTVLGTSHGVSFSSSFASSLLSSSSVDSAFSPGGSCIVVSGLGFWLLLLFDFEDFLRLFL